MSAHLCLSAEAQSNQKVTNKNGEGNKTAKDFQFEVVSIRPVAAEKQGVRYMVSAGLGTTPDGYREVTNLYDMIKFAYPPKDAQPGAFSDQSGPVGNPTSILNAPSWCVGWYEIDARVATSDISAWQAQGKDQGPLRNAMRTLLKDRFGLALHEQQTEIPIYNLVVSRKGIQFKPSIPGAVLPVGFKFNDGGVYRGRSRSEENLPVLFYNATMIDLIWLMEQSLIDRRDTRRYRAYRSL